MIFGCHAPKMKSTLPQDMYSITEKTMTIAHSGGIRCSKKCLWKMLFGADRRLWIPRTYFWRWRLRLLFFLLWLAFLVGTGWVFTRTTCLKSCLSTFHSAEFSLLVGREHARWAWQSRWLAGWWQWDLLGEHTHVPVKVVMAEDRNGARAQHVPQAVDRFH